MRRLCGQIILLCSLLLPCCGRSADGQPLADTRGISPQLGAAMARLVDDYMTLLPTVVSLEPRLEFQPGGSSISHAWSPARAQFGSACQDDSVGCTRLLIRQFDVYAALWGAHVASETYTERHAVWLSALVDLCELGWGLDMGYRCFPDQLRNIAGIASRIWMTLGYHHLFIALHNKEGLYQQQAVRLVERTEAFTPEQRAARLAALAPSATTFVQEALAAELEGRPSGAVTSWALALGRTLLSENDTSLQFRAMSNLLRLAAQQAQPERQLRWEKLQQDLLARQPAFKQQVECLLRTQQYDVEVAHMANSGQLFDGTGPLEQLIGADCPYSAQAIRYALLALRHGHDDRAVVSLNLALLACQRGEQCGPTRSQQLEQLLLIATGDGPALQRALVFWNSRLDAPTTMLGQELEFAWALAERLQKQGASQPALALLDRLDEYIHLLRRLYPAADLALYDELTRSRVKLKLASGVTLQIKEIEDLRARQLLRQLRLARWEKQLSKVDDPVALEKLNAQTQAGRELGQLLQRIGPDEYPALRASLELLNASMRDSEMGARETYLARLADKQAGHSDMSELGIVPTLDTFEPMDFTQGAGGGALGRDDAYLSWLSVPGGYIATLLARPLGRADPMAARYTVEVASQQFIPFSQQEEAMLRLYRELLQSGASMVRGARLSAPLENSEGGLMLGQQPLWQLPDGRLEASARAPEGAVRVQHFSALSDALYRKLLAPFASLYQDAQRLILIPDGALSYLPFETFSNKGVSVLESIDISYVQSLAVYKELQQRVAVRQRSDTPALLTLADPVFATTGAALGTSVLPAMQWPALPGTRVESGAIAALFRQPRRLLGRDASKAVLDDMIGKQALRNFRILHFATHGYVDDERSALLLTPGASVDSGFLTDQEIVRWDLASDLVILSACNTGVGRRQHGEGVVGLPYAFFMAGNVNTLMSLWAVDDAGTAVLIPAFIRRILQGEDNVTALNNVKRAFARGEYGAAMRNPRIWAAFVQYGAPLVLGGDKKVGLH